MDLLFWYTGWIVWAIIACLFFLAVAVTLIVALVRIWEWNSVWNALCKPTPKQRQALNASIRLLDKELKRLGLSDKERARLFRRARRQYLWTSKSPL